MRLFLVSQLLLVFISVLALTRAQTAPPTTTDTATTETSTAQPTPTDTATTTQAIAIATTTAWTAPPIFYPFGSAAGDTEQFENGGDTYRDVAFSTPFMFFGRMYNNTYVNNNGLLTFNQPLPEAHPYPFPTHGSEDFIAPLWTELDDIGIGRYSYQQYTNGSVLTRASQEINQYFPHKGFSASWVFVATWDYVQTSDVNVLNLHSAPAITFQVVLISGGGYSFILMNYGDCAATYYPVEAGYDTISSTDYHVIHYAFDGSYIPNLKNTSNVNVPGRWAFLVNNGTETENVIGVQLKLSSFLDLTLNENIEDVLQKIKQELVNRGASSFFEMKLRNVETDKEKNVAGRETFELITLT
ncbi:hypothetical protein R3I93_018238 [Phoxinus phoxinus]|uniref:NIDO domain-containing protein n=1 Tax=Phoxinus phoxinus TaxID=58324 RepID=A0AAN9GZ03_9TELE